MSEPDARARRVAALYDIHGNLPALEAVLDDVTMEHPDLVVVGGDVVWGPMPAETLNRVMTLDAPALFIRGNADREVADGEEGPYADVDRWCAAQLTEAELNILREWPATVSIEIEGLGSVCFCHGSPRRDDEPITLQTASELIDEMCAGRQESVIVCGHTHAQFDRMAGTRRVINPGSIGLPFEEAGAFWALFGPDVELRHTRYDVAAAAERIRRCEIPGAEAFADHIVAPAASRVQ